MIQVKNYSCMCLKMSIWFALRSGRRFMVTTLKWKWCSQTSIYRKGCRVFQRRKKWRKSQWNISLMCSLLPDSTNSLRYISYIIHKHIGAVCSNYIATNYQKTFKLWPWRASLNGRQKTLFLVGVNLHRFVAVYVNKRSSLKPFNTTQNIGIG